MAHDGSMKSQEDIDTIREYLTPTAPTQSCGGDDE